MTTRSVRTLALCLPLGALVGAIAFRAPELLILVAIAGCGLLLGQRPALLVGTFLFVDQTYPTTAYFSEIGPLVTTGHQLYVPIKGVPPALLLLLLGLVMLLHSGRGVVAKRLHTHGIDGVGIALAALVLWTTGISLAQEPLDFSGGTMLRIGTNTLAAVMPWFVALVAYALVVRSLREPGGRTALARVFAAALIIKGLLGLVVLLTTRGAVVDSQEYVVYYDAALPMVAGMAIIGFLLTSQRHIPWRKLLLLLAATIVVFSFRRSVWSAMVVAVVLLPLVRQNTVVLARIAVAATLMLLSLLVLPGSVKKSAFSRVGSAISVAQGTGNEDSAKNHKRDLEIGYQLAQENVWLGVGVRAEQSRELAFQDTDRLYVHNDPLQVWLRLGLPGLLGYLLLLAVLCRRGLRALRRTSALPLLDAGCAAFAVVCLVPAMTAPFISDTMRWPVLVAIAAAVLRVNETEARDAAEAARRAARGVPAPQQRQLARAR